jgi:hypothetical protein
MHLRNIIRHLHAAKTIANDFGRISIAPRHRFGVMPTLAEGISVFLVTADKIEKDTTNSQLWPYFDPTVDGDEKLPPRSCRNPAGEHCSENKHYVEIGEQGCFRSGGGFLIPTCRSRSPRICAISKKTDNDQGSLDHARSCGRRSAVLAPLRRSSSLAFFALTIQIEGEPRLYAPKLAITCSAIDSDAVSPGDSMPNRCTSPAMPCSAGVSIMKSAAGSPAPMSFGRIPA